MFLKLTIATMVTFLVPPNSLQQIPNVIFIDPSMSTRPTPPRVTFKSAAESIKNLFTNSLQSFSSSSGQQNGQTSHPPREQPSLQAQSASGSPGVIVIEGNRKRANNMIIVMAQGSGTTSPATTSTPETNLQSPEVLEHQVRGLVGGHTHSRHIDEELSGSERVPVGHDPAFSGFGSQNSFESYQSPNQYSPPIQTMGFQQFRDMSQKFQPDASYYQPPIQVPSPGYPRIHVSEVDVSEQRTVSSEKVAGEQYDEDETRDTIETVSTASDDGQEPQVAYSKMMKSMMKKTDKEMMKMMKGMMKKMKDKKSGEEKSPSKYPPESGEEDSGKKESEEMGDDMKYEEEEGEDMSSQGDEGKDAKTGQMMMPSPTHPSPPPEKGCSEEDMKMLKDMMMVQMMMMGKMAGGGKTMMPQMMSPCKMKQPEHPVEYFPEPYPEPEQIPYSPPYPVKIEHHHHHAPASTPSYHSVGYSSDQSATFKFPMHSGNNSGQMVTSNGQPSPQDNQPSNATSFVGGPGPTTVVAPGSPCPPTQHVHLHGGGSQPVSQLTPTGHSYIQVQVEPATHPAANLNLNQQNHHPYQNPMTPDPRIPIFTAKSFTVPPTIHHSPNQIIDGIILEEEPPGQSNNHHSSWIMKTNSNGNLLNGLEQRQHLGQSISPPTSFHGFYTPNLIPSGSSVSSETSAKAKNKKKYYRPPGHDRMITDKITRESLENGRMKGRDSGSEVIREVYSDTHRIEVIKRLGSDGGNNIDENNFVRQRALRGK